MTEESMESVKWALERMIALRKAGEEACFRIVWANREGVRHYRLEIRLASGVIERPIFPLPLGTSNAVEESPVFPSPERGGVES